MTITAQQVIEWMGITQNLEPVEEIAAAVTEYINALPSTHRAFAVGYPEVVTDADTDYSQAWGPRQRTAALMLASRWYRRRNSPNGVESAAGDIAVYVTKYDSDIARLLEIDGFDKPDVG
jgi:hypothetical protein